MSNSHRPTRSHQQQESITPNEIILKLGELLRISKTPHPNKELHDTATQLLYMQGLLAIVDLVNANEGVIDLPTELKLKGSQDVYVWAYRVNMIQQGVITPELQALIEQQEAQEETQ